MKLQADLGGKMKLKAENITSAPALTPLKLDPPLKKRAANPKAEPATENCQQEIPAQQARAPSSPPVEEVVDSPMALPISKGKSEISNMYLKRLARHAKLFKALWMQGKR